MKKAKKSTKRSRATKRPSSKATVKRGKARQSVLIADPKAPKSRRVRIELPVDADAADHNEGEHFIKVLDANKQLARGSGALPPGATHQLEPDGSGSHQVVRKRYSAI